MPVIVGIFVLAAVVGIVVLVRFISKGDPRTALWAVFLVLATVIASVLAQLALVNYTIPIGWIVTVAAALIVLVALVSFLGRDVGWKISRIAAIAGLMLLTLITLTFVLIALPVGGLFMPLFEARAQQIAEANGFTMLLPADAEMTTDAGMPVDDTEDGEGVIVGYSQFILSERKAEGTVGPDELRELLEAGDSPTGGVGPGREIPKDATYTELEVDGARALAVSYVASTEERMDDLLGTDPVHVLVFERDGVIVTLHSQGYLEYQSDGSSIPRDPLSLGELTAIGESLKPVE